MPSFQVMNMLHKNHSSLTCVNIWQYLSSKGHILYTQILITDQSQQINSYGVCVCVYGAWVLGLNTGTHTR